MGQGTGLVQGRAVMCVRLLASGHSARPWAARRDVLVVARACVLLQAARQQDRKERRPRPKGVGLTGACACDGDEAARQPCVAAVVSGLRARRYTARLCVPWQEEQGHRTLTGAQWKAQKVLACEGGGVRPTVPARVLCSQRVRVWSRTARVRERCRGGRVRPRSWAGARVSSGGKQSRAHAVPCSWTAQSCPSRGFTSLGWGYPWPRHRVRGRGCEGLRRTCGWQVCVCQGALMTASANGMVVACASLRLHFSTWQNREPETNASTFLAQPRACTRRRVRRPVVAPVTARVLPQLLSGARRGQV